MAQTIKIKRSDSTSAPSSLVAGELAYSGNSNKLFIGHPDGTTGVITIGGTYYTSIVDGAASANTASKLVIRDASGNFSAGAVTVGSLVVTGTVDGVDIATRDGILTSTTTTAGAALPKAGGAMTGAITTNSTFDGRDVATDGTKLDGVEASADVTDATNVAGAGALMDSELTSIADVKALNQGVTTTSNVTFNNVAVDGTLTSDDIQATTLTASGHVIVTGDLTVNGTTTTVNSNTVAIGDAIMTLNSDEAGTPSANAGLEVERGTATNVTMLWNETSDYWQVYDGTTTSKIMTAGNFAAGFTGIIDGGTF